MGGLGKDPRPSRPDHGPSCPCPAFSSLRFREAVTVMWTCLSHAGRSAARGCARFAHRSVSSTFSAQGRAG